MYIEREIWKGGKVVGDKSIKIILNRSTSSFDALWKNGACSASFELAVWFAPQFT